MVYAPRTWGEEIVAEFDDESADSGAIDYMKFVDKTLRKKQVTKGKYSNGCTPPGRPTAHLNPRAPDPGLTGHGPVHEAHMDLYGIYGQIDYINPGCCYEIWTSGLLNRIRLIATVCFRC